MPVNSVVIMLSYYEAIRPLDDKERLQMYDAILDYAFTGAEPADLPPMLMGYFALIKPTMDASIRRYNASAANGKMGGRPRRSNAETHEKPSKNLDGTQKEPTKNLEETQQKPSENLNKDMDKDVDKDMDLDKDKDKDKDEDSDKDENTDSIINNNNINNNTLERYAMNNLQYLSPYNLEELVSFLDSMDEDLIRHAIDVTTANGIRAYSYTRAILNSYVNAGIKTVGDALKAEDERRKAREKNGTNRRNNAKATQIYAGETIV